MFERNDAKKGCEYKFYTEFQSHEPEFDYLKSLEIEAYKPGEKAMLVDQYYFENVLVSSLTNLDANYNNVTIQYGRFSHGHIEQNEQGGLEPAVESGWDFMLNKAFSAPVDSDLF